MVNHEIESACSAELRSGWVLAQSPLALEPLWGMGLTSLPNTLLEALADRLDGWSAVARSG